MPWPLRQFSKSASLVSQLEDATGPGVINVMMGRPFPKKKPTLKKLITNPAPATATGKLPPVVPTSEIEVLPRLRIFLQFRLV